MSDERVTCSWVIDVLYRAQVLSLIGRWLMIVLKLPKNMEDEQRVQVRSSSMYHYNSYSSILYRSLWQIFQDSYKI